MTTMPRYRCRTCRSHQLGEAAGSLPKLNSMDLRYVTSLQVEESLRLDGNWQSIVIVMIKLREGLNVAVTAIAVQYTCVSLTYLLH